MDDGYTAPGRHQKGMRLQLQLQLFSVLINVLIIFLDQLLNYTKSKNSEKCLLKVQNNRKPRDSLFTMINNKEQLQ